MQQSDSLLLSTLRQYIQLPNSLTTIGGIESDNIYQISCAVFEVLKVDYSELKQISQFQKFRLRTKLTQTINQNLDTSFDLNDIINPTLPFLRKLLLAFISRLGAAEGEKNKALISKGAQRDQNKYQKEVFKRWVNQEYICPELRLHKKVKYQPFLMKLQIKKDVFKRNIGGEFGRLGGANCNAILQASMAKEANERKKRQAQEGITRKAPEENDRNVYRIVKNNFDDWHKSEISLKNLKKIFIQRNSKIHEQQQGMSVFQQQVQRIAQQQKKLKGLDDKKTTAQNSQILSMEQDLNPLEKIKRECENQKICLENQIQQILKSLSQTKQSIQKKQALKQRYIDQITQFEQKGNEQKQGRGALKKRAEKQKLLLDALEGDSDITKEVNQLQKQVSFLQTEAQKQISKLMEEIKTTKDEGEQKLDVLKNLKLRLHKIQTDYAKVCQEIQDKTQIKGKVKITQSGISRLYYSKKISQMEVRWREAIRQSKKIHTDVVAIRDNVNKLLSFAQRSQKQIQNTSNSSKFRGEIQNNEFKQILGKCQNTFKRTVDCIEQLNETKNEIQQFEMKVHMLAGKDHKSNIKKIQTALEELKKEIKQLSKK